MILNYALAIMLALLGTVTMLGTAVTWNLKSMGERTFVLSIIALQFGAGLRLILK